MMLGALLVAAAEASAPAAQPPPTDRPDAIIITGERSRRSLKDTPSSVVVFGKRDIDQLPAADRIQQLLQLTPNVMMGSTRDTPVIRGQAGSGALSRLPAFLGGARPRTVVQIDGRTITF